MNRPPFPLIWDNSMRASFVECPRKFFWEYLHHFKPLSQNVHLHAGKAWAQGLEITRRAFYGEKRPPLEALSLGLNALMEAYGDFDPGPKSNKSLERLMEAFAYYWRTFPLESDPLQPFIGPNGPMIEFSFAIPLHDISHPESGEPIIYVGRADMIATYAGALSIYDDKTTSSLGPSWASQWQRRSQFSGYVWAARESGIPARQVVVRGIALLKTEIKHAEAITIRTDHHLLEWREQLSRDLRRAISSWNEGYWDLNLSDACSSYGNCMFLNPCHSQNPEPWLTGGNYAIRKWNPATREEEVLE